MRTGPKTIKGKRHSSQNALRHGLSRSLKRDESYEVLLKSWAEKILGPHGDPKFLGLAYGIAEALLEINRIRQIDYDRSNLSFDHRQGKSAKRMECTSFDTQSTRYLSRAYGRLRSKIRQFDRARLFHDHSGLQSNGLILSS